MPRTDHVDREQITDRCGPIGNAMKYTMQGRFRLLLVHCKCTECELGVSVVMNSLSEAVTMCEESSTRQQYTCPLESSGHVRSRRRLMGGDEPPISSSDMPCQWSIQQNICNQAFKQACGIMPALQEGNLIDNDQFTVPTRLPHSMTCRWDLQNSARSACF